MNHSKLSPRKRDLDIDTCAACWDAEKLCPRCQRESDAWEYNQSLCNGDHDEYTDEPAVTWERGSLIK